MSMPSGIRGMLGSSGEGQAWGAGPSKATAHAQGPAPVADPNSVCPNRTGKGIRGKPAGSASKAREDGPAQSRLPRGQCVKIFIMDDHILQKWRMTATSQPSRQQSASSGKATGKIRVW
eukprot:365273-Chlamydomonas_euryale.AAC.15